MFELLLWPWIQKIEELYIFQLCGCMVYNLTSFVCILTREYIVKEAFHYKMFFNSSMFGMLAGVFQYLYLFTINTNYTIKFNPLDIDYTFPTKYSKVLLMFISGYNAILYIASHILTLSVGEMTIFFRVTGIFSAIIKHGSPLFIIVNCRNSTS